MINILIKGGRLLDPANGIDAQQDLYIRNGKISAPLTHIDQTIDATGMIVSPGFIDLCSQLPEPGYSQKGTLLSEVTAATSAGITTLCCNPATKPVIDSTAVTNLIKDKANKAGMANVLPLGALTQGLAGEQLSNMHGLTEAGCIALSNGRNALSNNLVAQRCYEYASTYDLLVYIHPLDHDLADNGCMHDGSTSTRLGLEGISAIAETIAVAQHLLLIEQTGIRAHFCQISTARSAQMIIDAQAKGLPVTADTPILNLLYTDECIYGFNSLFHVQPPLRTSADQQGLIAAVKSGNLAISANHCAHEVTAKMAPFAASEAGASTYDSFTSMALALVENNHLTLNEVINAISALPSKILSINAGDLSEGQPADIAIIDPTTQWELNETSQHSSGINNPLQDQTLTGRVRYTLVNGAVVYSAD
jgi:dihydroorotase